MTNEITSTPPLLDLYRQAFEQFGAHALWNKRQVDSPTPADALVIARALRIEGNLEARFLAEKIEQAYRAFTQKANLNPPALQPLSPTYP